jgi:hypothetical protein
MRTKYVLITVLFAGSAHANIIPLSDFRSVSVSGVAGIVGGGDSYSQEQTPSGPFNKFNGNVAGSADWSDPAPTSWYGLMGSYHADSSANQSSTITADQISVDANLWGSTRVSLVGPYGPASSFASSIFEVSFGVLTPLEYQLDEFHTAGFHDLPPPSFDFYLGSATAGTILANSNLAASSHSSGVLLPDVYTLRFNANLSTVPDPLGDFKFASYSLNLRVASVPDNASSAVLLLISLVVLIGTHQAMARMTRVTG